MKFGLYSFDMKTKERTMREGARHLGQVYNTVPSNLKMLREYITKEGLVNLKDK